MDNQNEDNNENKPILQPSIDTENIDKDEVDWKQYWKDKKAGRIPKGPVTTNPTVLDKQDNNSLKLFFSIILILVGLLFYIPSMSLQNSKSGGFITDNAIGGLMLIPAAIMLSFGVFLLIDSLSYFFRINNKFSSSSFRLIEISVVVILFALLIILSYRSL